MNKEFIQDRTNLLINLDNIRIEEVEEYCKKYNIPILTNKKCMIAGLHKARIYSIDKGITKNMKDKSKKWLKNNGFSEFII